MWLCSAGRWSVRKSEQWKPSGCPRRMAHCLRHRGLVPKHFGLVQSIYLLSRYKAMELWGGVNAVLYGKNIMYKHSVLLICHTEKNGISQPVSNVCLLTMPFSIDRVWVKLIAGVRDLFFWHVWTTAASQSMGVHSSSMGKLRRGNSTPAVLSTCSLA